MFKKVLEKIKNKRLLIVVILLFFVVNIFAIYTTFTEKTTSTIWDGSIAKKFKKGSGTASDPYQISDGSEFAYFFTLINGEDSGDYFNKFYVLKNNIDFNGYDLSFATFQKTFSGNLNGNGFSLYNFSLNKYYLSEDGSEAYFGLFDSLYSANIQNINLSDITFNVNENEIVGKKIKINTNTDNNTDNTNNIDNKDNTNNTDDTTNTDKTDNKTVGSENNENVLSTKNYSIKKVVEDENVNNNETNNQNEKVENNDSNVNSEEVKKDDTTSTNEKDNTNENLNLDDEKNTENDDKSSDVTEETKNDSIIDGSEIKDEDNNEVKNDEIITDENNEEVNDDNNQNTPKDEIIDVKVEKIIVSLFGKEVEKTKLLNININNIKLVYNGKEKILTSSLFIVNDNGNNTFENINIYGDSNVKTTTLLINKYDESSTFNNILFRNDILNLINGLDANDYDEIFHYEVKNGKLSFFKKYPVKSVLELLNDNSSLTWKIQNNLFRIVNNGTDGSKIKKANKMLRSAPSAHASGKDSSSKTVYINDYSADANYYEGLNYTYSSNGSIPSRVDKNIYNDTNLVYTQINYYGTNYEGNSVGTVSTTEDYNKFVYYKIYPVNTNGTTSKNDDYLLIDLIDNPFSNHPIDRTFNGWLSVDNNIQVSLDIERYVRTVKIPVTYNGDNPNNVNIDLYALWGPGKIVNYSSSWSNTFSKLEDKGLSKFTDIADLYEDLTQLYFRRSISRGTRYPAGAVNSNGNSLTGTCDVWIIGCTYYIHSPSEFDSSAAYYKLENGSMRSYTPQIIGTQYTSDLPVGSVIAGYYRRVTVPRNASLVGYYNISGEVYTSGSCQTYGGCSAYEQISYTDSNGDVELLVEGQDYYYYVTRDTNIIIMTSNLSSSWSSSQNKPFTFTAVSNGTNNLNTYSWDVRYTAVECYNDTRIENIRIRGVSTVTNTGAIANDGNAPTDGGLFGNYYNLKIGRGITQYSTTTTTTNFDYVVGGNNSSKSDLTSFTLIIESGVYNNLGLIAPANSTSRSVYVKGYGTYGSDYDRVSKDNDKLDIKYCASGSWGNNLYTNSDTDPTITVTVKSGKFGSNEYDYAAGLYIGGRSYGKHHAPRVAIFEGGEIFTITGGPLIEDTYNTKNNTFLYMKGGSVDVIVGGAGQSETYGNRIIQITDGLVNYSVFGGSNGVTSNGTTQKGNLDGDSYVYVGGNATIGLQSLVDDNTKHSKANVEAGSVFGIGNGKEGSDEIGTVNNSNVIINGNAKINRNVYGGGNYGAVGQNGSNKTYNTNIVIHKGEIKGSVYGGGNNNGAGTNNNTSNIYIKMDGGSVSGSIYGGSRTTGTINGTVNIDIEAGTVYTDVYGGGEGGYKDNNNKGTYVKNNVNVSIGTSNGGPTINGSVYGGSAYGTVNGTTNTPTTSNRTVNVTVNNGTILKSVFGGAKGGELDGTTYTPIVNGNITVNINNGTITNVFGGCDEKGKPGGDVTVYINGGTVTNAYGGGNKTSVDETNIYLTGGTVTTMYGGSNESGDVETTNVNIQGGIVTTVYGGNNEGGTVDETNINITGGTINTAVYGGGNLVNSGETNIDVYNITNTLPSLYGGGNKAGATTTQVTLHSQSSPNNINITNVYGGSNESGDVTTSNITVQTGTVGSLYGGNNAGGKTTTSNIEVNNGTVTTLFGGGNEADNGETSISVTGGTITTLYGGGNKAKIDNNTTINVSNGSITTLYGGGNEGAVGGSTSVTITNTTGTITSVYGGGNKAGVDNNTTINVSGGSMTTLYGGGNEGVVGGDTNVTITNNTGTITSVYGGGNKAGATNTNITLDTGTPNNISITDLYGGSNQQGNVSESTIIVNAGTVGNLYGGNNAGGKTTETNITQNGGSVSTIYGGGNEAESDTTNITVTAGSVTNVYGGGNKAVVTDTTNVTINGNTSLISNVFGGGNQAGTDKSYVTVEEDNSTVNITNLFGGSNQSGTVNESHVVINSGTVTNAYGGNNAGGTTTDSNISINAGTIGNVFGGGNRAVSGSATVVVSNGTINTLYAGGNAAAITNGTSLTMTGGTVNTNVYGGGNEGTVGKDTNVLIHNTNINGSAYAGGNGSTATVFGNTNITVSGTTVVGTSSCTVLSTCSVFGGGNAAITGSELTNNSTAKVNITGAKVYGNVYGGANTSKVYGETYVNIGDDVPLGTNIVKGDIDITGTVFGGGEANASGSDTYDWTFVSVTKGILVNINGNGYNNFKISGSIFGSGNASTSGGTSEVYVKNYGTYNNPQHNISIQRTDLLVLDNSAIVLAGATDRENEYSDVLFTLSRIDELDLTNNSTLFLETGANLLQKFKSLTSTGVLAAVTINKETGTVTKNVDNRVYMFMDKVLNVAKNQNATDYGEVSGMSFFGMYKYDSNGDINVGIYDDYAYGATLDWGDVFDNVSSYVLGLHKINHDITVDGFYTNYIDEATSKNLMDYIDPIPPSGPLYMWQIGSGVIEYSFEMTASKYSTLGTYELTLRDFTEPNTSFQILGFDYSDLDSSISLINKNDIKKIADSETDANTKMGLSMETSNNGWLVNGNTTFLTNSNNSVVGTQEYIGGNNTSAPTLLFYLHHSKNISETASMGKVKIQLLSIRQVDALTKESKRLIITIDLNKALLDTVNYEGAMTAGRKYDLFTSTATNITSSSSISAYYSLFNVGNSIYREGYHRALISNYVLPLNTKITMIDFSNDNPEYYYHVINSTDVANATTELQNDRQVSYNLSMMEIMGAENSGIYYNDAQKNISYYNSTGNYVNEEFIFIIDFADTNISTDQLGNQLFIEIRDANSEAIYSVLAPQHLDLTYNVYTNKDAVIDIKGNVDKNKIYNGESLIADLEIDYTQTMIGSTVIYDTHYFDSKLGIKVSLINEDNEVVTGTTLLGLYYEIDGVKYYPNIDGTARIKVADKVDSAEKWVIVNTGTSTISSGNYKLRFESFGSPDGIYYGLESSDYVDFNIEIVNEIYGLDVTTTPEEMIIDKETGLNANGNANLKYNFDYNSGLKNPSIHVKMYRRGVNSIDDTTYSVVDLQDYIKYTLLGGNVTNEYLLISNPKETKSYTFTFNDNLVSGTYKMEFILYDGGSKIGTVEKYIIIK